MQRALCSILHVLQQCRGAQTCIYAPQCVAARSLYIYTYVHQAGLLWLNYTWISYGPQYKHHQHHVSLFPHIAGTSLWILCSIGLGYNSPDILIHNNIVLFTIYNIHIHITYTTVHNVQCRTNHRVGAYRISASSVAMLLQPWQRCILWSSTFVSHIYRKRTLSRS